MAALFTNARFFFSKTGRARYISHLDLYRAVGRALKRASLPVWLTEGFNPHIYLTFALPLALGIEGEKETFDVRLTEEIGFDEAAARLNAVMPADLRVLNAAAPVHNHVEITSARYEIILDGGESRGFAVFLDNEAVIIEKKRKKGTERLDIKPHLQYSPLTGGVSLTLPAGTAFNINPLTVLNAYKNNPPERIRRVGIMLENGEEFC